MRGNRTVIVSADVDNYDLAPYVSEGRLDIVLVIRSGVFVGGNLGNPSTAATSQAAKNPASIRCTVPITAAKSHLYLINNGTIYGVNGQGGWGFFSAPFSDYAGGDGASAIELSCPITIHNSGNIWGGGGGGGGGGNFTLNTVGGYGGGYPQGQVATSYPNQGAVSKYGVAVGGWNSAINVRAGASGGAGNTGNAGQNGTYAGAAGGSIGYCVDASGNTVTWLSGNNPTQVKGAVN
jgi:hypothetical protein